MDPVSRPPMPPERRCVVTVNGVSCPEPPRYPTRDESVLCERHDDPGNAETRAWQTRLAAPAPAPDLDTLFRLRGYPEAGFGWVADPIGSYVRWDDLMASRLAAPAPALDAAWNDPFPHESRQSLVHRIELLTADLRAERELAQSESVTRMLAATNQRLAAPALDAERLARVLDAHYDARSTCDEDGHCDRLCAAAIAALPAQGDTHA